MNEPQANSWTPQEFRDALGNFPTGVAVVTAEVDGHLLGSTISSFNSVSLTPPLVLFSIANSAASYELWCKAEFFVITILGDSERDLSNRFARGGADKWRDLTFERNAAGCPLLPGGLVRFECRRYAIYEGGDHDIFVGEVQAFRSIGGLPLLFHRGKYQNIQSEAELPTPYGTDVWLHGW